MKGVEKLQTDLDSLGDWAGVKVRH